MSQTVVFVLPLPVLLALALVLLVVLVLSALALSLRKPVQVRRPATAPTADPDAIGSAGFRLGCLHLDGIADQPSPRRAR
jgi:hypothetical protein